MIGIIFIETIVMGIDVIVVVGEGGVEFIGHFAIAMTIFDVAISLPIVIVLSLEVPVAVVFSVTIIGRRWRGGGGSCGNGNGCCCIERHINNGILSTLIPFLLIR